MLELVNIGKTYGSQRPENFSPWSRRKSEQHIALFDVNLKFQEGEFFSLLGPSGCGKTTLLRIIAGLESSTGGKISLDGIEIQELPPQSRPFNMVFQRYALFPHLTVEENLRYGLRIKGLNRAEQNERIEGAIKMMGLEELKDRLPETLSGGQSQRVALSRALVNRPRILLLDEPLSALDLKMREHLQNELRSLQKRLGLTFIYVTHDQQEAMCLSDRIAVMNRGRIEQVATPELLYNKPETAFTASFIGQMSKFEGELVSFERDTWTMRLANGKILTGHRKSQNQPLMSGLGVQALIRPEKIQFQPIELNSLSSGEALQNSIRGFISARIFKGDQVEAYVRLPDLGEVKIVSHETGDLSFAEGSEVQLQFPSHELHLFGTSVV